MGSMMWSRRRLLMSTLAGAAGFRNATGSVVAPQPTTTVDFQVPPCACDSHVHVFGDPRRFPFAANRTYTPPPALVSELASLHAKLGIQRVVIVTASAYGVDNSATLAAVRERAPHARAIAVVDERAGKSELQQLEHEGVCGLRLFIADANQSADDAKRRFERTVLQIDGRRHWHIQIFTTLPIVAALRDLVRESPVPVVFDHFGGAQGEFGVEQPGFADLLAMVRSGHAYVKLSGAYRLSKRWPDFADMAPLVQALVAANQDRLLWGTDWPHTSGVLPGRKPTDLFPFTPIDDAHLFNLFAGWVSDPALRKRILVDNPSRLYGFTDV